MIRYRLECSAGHGFDSWFASSDAYDMLEARGEVVCPVCSDRNVRKALMAPRIATERTRGALADAAAESASGSSSIETGANSADDAQASPEAAAIKELRAKIKAVRDEILSRSENVGSRFAEEARRIHHEEAPDRAIHGDATREEVLSLHEDGIDVLPVPRLPEDLT